MYDQGVKYCKAMLLEDGWRWKEFDDGSGHLENDKGQSYFSYDIQTQEYICRNNKWQFMDDYPARTSFDKFKCYMESDLVESGIAKYNPTVLSIATLENEFDVNQTERAFKYDCFFKWSAYKNVEELQKALMDLYEQRDCENEFDINFVDRLAEFYSPSAICEMMTDDNKEIFVDAVEMKMDYSEYVSEEMYEVYKAVISEQSQSSEPMMQM